LELNFEVEQIREVVAAVGDSSALFIFVISFGVGVGNEDVGGKCSGS
jgi:hypothetical protein